MEKIAYEILEREEPVVLAENLGFGKYFTDHIFVMDYSPVKGWHDAKIMPLRNLSLHPATTFIHYGQTIFEGLKAYYGENGDILLFRPEKNYQRLNNSARRLCMPEIDIDFMVEATKELVRIDKDWVPRNNSDTLYVRPFMVGSDPFLGVRPSADYKMFVMLSPVGAYYPEGFKPVKILIQDDYVRAVRKGLGECKTAANYAASMLGAEIARKQGYTQVLWLDAVELKYIEEVGTMNIFIQIGDEVITPKLTGGILPGITRLSVIDILRDWGMTVTERQISIDEFMAEYDKGNVKEVFGSGTAAVISSVGELKYKDRTLPVSGGEIGPLAQKLFDHLTAIQRGKVEDKFGWTLKVEIPVNA